MTTLGFLRSLCPRLEEHPRRQSESTAASQVRSSSPYPGLLPGPGPAAPSQQTMFNIMGDLLSLSVVLSLLSLLTSFLTLLRFGSSHITTNLNLNFLSDDTSRLILGKDQCLNVPFGIVGSPYPSEQEFLKINQWPMRKAGLDRPVPIVYQPQPPLSMAKIIMSRHAQRRPTRTARRIPGVALSPMPSSRLVETIV